MALHWQVLEMLGSARPARCLSQDGHEVLELWTKRKFRCDCGISKFGELYYKFDANKDPKNTDNTYSKNFKGSYCTCGCPYPDPQAEEHAEMIHCCVCEDWFHEKHIGLDTSEELPINEEGDALYDEFICQDYALKCSFMRLYSAAVCYIKRKYYSSKKTADGNVLKKYEGGHDSASLMKCSRAMSKNLSTEKDSVYRGNTTKKLDS